MTQAIWFLAIAQTLLWGALYYLFPALLLHWEHDYGWGRSELTLALALAVVISALFAPLAGRFADRGAAVLMQPICALAGALLLLLLPFAESLIQFYLVWGLIGVTMAGCLYETCFAFVIRHLGEASKRPITQITLVAGFASTLCFPMAAFFAEQFSVNTAVQFFAATIIFIAAPLFWLGARSLEQHYPAVKHAADEAAHSNHSFLRKPAFWLLAASFSLLTINHGVILNHLLPILDDRGIPDAIALLAISMIGPMQVLGRVMWMAFDRYLSVSAVTLGCFAGINLATVCLIFSTDAIPLLIFFVVFQGAAYGVVSIVKPLLAREIMGGRNFGAISGSMAVPYLTCFAASPYIGALLWEWQGYALTLWAILLFSLIGMGTLLIALGWHNKGRATYCCPEVASGVSLNSDG